MPLGPVIEAAYEELLNLPLEDGYRSGAPAPFFASKFPSTLVARKCCTCRWWRPPAVECCCTVLGAGPCCLLSRRPRLHLLERQGGFMFATHLPSAASWRGWARRSCCSRRGTGCAACGAALVCSAPRCRCVRARACVCVCGWVCSTACVCVWPEGLGEGCVCVLAKQVRHCQLAAMLRPCGAAANWLPCSGLAAPPGSNRLAAAPDCLRLACHRSTPLPAASPAPAAD